MPHDKNYPEALGHLQNATWNWLNSLPQGETGRIFRIADMGEPFKEDSDKVDWARVMTYLALSNLINQGNKQAQNKTENPKYPNPDITRHLDENTKVGRTANIKYQNKLEEIGQELFPNLKPPTIEPFKDFSRGGSRSGMKIW